MQKINKCTVQPKNRRRLNQLCEDYDNLPYITKKIYNFIVESGLTQKEFAEKIGMTQQSICRLFKFNEKTQAYPKVTKQMRDGMMKAYNLPLDWFVADGDVNTDDAPKGESRKSQLARLQYVKDYLINTGRITSLFDLSNKMGIAREYPPLIFDGRMDITIDFLNSLNETFGFIFDINWVMKGEGDMLAKKDDKDGIIASLKAQIAELTKQLNDAAIEIIKLNTELRKYRE